MDAARRRSQFVRRGVRHILDRIELPRDVAMVNQGSRDPQPHLDLHETLLGPVVQVLFEASPFALGGLNDAQA
jgi:hypothetical protein